MDYIQFRVTGIVQGVNFRYFTQKQASSLGVKGWVRNNPDDSVEGVAVGPADKIKQFRLHVNKGPPHARVDKLEIKAEKHGLSAEDAAAAIDGAKGYEVRR